MTAVITNHDTDEILYDSVINVIITTTVFCSLQVEGLHKWSDCDIAEVDYLANEHRHIFYITVYKMVNHGDRDIEFIKLKHEIQDFLKNAYYDNERKIHNFEGMSCEHIATELLNTFKLSKCVVSEDNENGAIVEKIYE